MYADDTRLEVRGLQSTSNMLRSSHVNVDTDQPLLWMTEFRDPMECNLKEAIYERDL